MTSRASEANRENHGAGSTSTHSLQTRSEQMTLFVACQTQAFEPAVIYGRGAMLSATHPECAAFGERHHAVQAASQPAPGLDARESRPLPSVVHRPAGARPRHVPL